jgi:hypothetical protein
LPKRFAYNFIHLNNQFVICSSLHIPSESHVRGEFAHVLEDALGPILVRFVRVTTTLALVTNLFAASMRQVLCDLHESAFLPVVFHALHEGLSPHFDDLEKLPAPVALSKLSSGLSKFGESANFTARVTVIWAADHLVTLDWEASRFAASVTFLASKFERAEATFGRGSESRGKHPFGVCLGYFRGLLLLAPAVGGDPFDHILQRPPQALTPIIVFTKLLTGGLGRDGYTSGSVGAWFEGMTTACTSVSFLDAVLLREEL